MRRLVRRIDTAVMFLSGDLDRFPELLDRRVEVLLGLVHVDEMVGVVLRVVAGAC